MDVEKTITSPLVLLALRLVQPGKLSDVVDGVARLLGSEPTGNDFKKVVSHRLEALRESDFVCLYGKQRYMLTNAGKEVVEVTGIKLQIDHRRMFLLKETRRANAKVRSGARDGSL